MTTTELLLKWRIKAISVENIFSFIKQFSEISKFFTIVKINFNLKFLLFLQQRNDSAII